MEATVGKVISITDINDGGRIKVRLDKEDKRTSDFNLPYAFPLLPKIIHIKPKVGEGVLVFHKGNGDGQRFYIGPITSQLQNLFKDNVSTSTALFQGGVSNPQQAISTYSEANGAIPNDDEIALLGRKNSDIILSDNDVRIRCGAKINDTNSPVKVAFNKTSPSFLKLTYHETPIEAEKTSANLKRKTKTDVKSTANLIGQEINLISTEGDPYINVCNPNEKSISDEDIAKLIATAHQLPYGDKLVDFLKIFLKTFLNHTHVYPLAPTCPSPEVVNLMNFDFDSIVSKNVRIN